MVDTDGGDFHPTGLFWFLAHFSRWVRPGAVRVGATAKALPAGVEAVAFEGGRGHVVQLVNSGGDDEKVAVCDGAGHVATLTLPALSITTARNPTCEVKQSSGVSGKIRSLLEPSEASAGIDRRLSKFRGPPWV